MYVHYDGIAVLQKGERILGLIIHNAATDAAPKRFIWGCIVITEWSQTILILKQIDYEDSLSMIDNAEYNEQVKTSHSYNDDK